MFLRIIFLGLDENAYRSGRNASWAKPEPSVETYRYVDRSQITIKLVYLGNLERIVAA